jgi:uncharacterized protein YpmS
MKLPAADNNIWKWICGILVSILLSVTGTFYAVAGDFVTKPEMHAEIASDHDLIKETRDDVKEMRRRIEAMTAELGKLEGMLAAGGNR